jgi:hypothetical protein
VRNELRTEIELQRRAIVATQEQLAETSARIEEARLRPDRERSSNERISRTPSREMGLVLER